MGTSGSGPDMGFLMTLWEERQAEVAAIGINESFEELSPGRVLPQSSVTAIHYVLFRSPPLPLTRFLDLSLRALQDPEDLRRHINPFSQLAGNLPEDPGFF